MGIGSIIKHAWNTFTGNPESSIDLGSSSWTPTYKKVRSYSSTQFVASIYNRIAIDVSMANIRHVKIDEETEDAKVIKSGLSYCLNVEANLDQSNIAFMHDLVYSMFDEGVVAVVPVDTTISPKVSEGYEINTMRVGRITQWYPEHVRINLYNQKTGQNEDITMMKKHVAIIENPLYAVMNSENSILKRLLTKIAQLDALDDVHASGKLDLIIQLPYGIRSKAQRIMAEKRVKDIELQLASGRHGIIYADSTEKITQLSRPSENQISASIAELTGQFYNQLGLTETIFNGTATEEELRIYYSRTIDPIMEHILAELSRKFLTKTARTQGHQLEYFRDMFKFVTIEMIASLGDTVRRNSILTSNEVRKILRFKSSDDPRADELFNPNIADKNQMMDPYTDPYADPYADPLMDEPLTIEEEENL